MDTSIKTVKIILLLAVMMLGIAGLAPSAKAAILSANLVDASGNVVDLKYDWQTQSYADGSLPNPNIYAQICANTSTELQNKYAGIYYKVSSSTIPLQVLPAQITSVNASNCTTVDVDITFFTARYAGVPTIIVGDDTSFSNPEYYQLNQLTYSNGYCNGSWNYTTVLGTNSLSTVINSPLDNSGGAITTNKSYILVGVQTLTGIVLDVEQVYPQQTATLTWDNDPTDYLNINGMLVSLIMPTPAPIGGGDGWENITGVGKIVGEILAPIPLSWWWLLLLIILILLVSYAIYKHNQNKKRY